MRSSSGTKMIPLKVNGAEQSRLPACEQGVREPKSGRPHEGRPQVVSPQFRGGPSARIGLCPTYFLLELIFMVRRSSKNHDLFISQRDHRIDFGRTPRWHVTRRQ